MEFQCKTSRKETILMTKVWGGILLEVVKKLDGRMWDKLISFRAKGSAVISKQVVITTQDVKPRLGLKIKIYQQMSMIENSNMAE
jgi:hypothetical protein